MSHPEFSVCQFFVDGSYEYVRRFVEAKEAVEAFKHYANSVGAKLGVVSRVIVTDGGDCVNMEWKDGRYTYPPELLKFNKEGHHNAKPIEG